MLYLDCYKSETEFPVMTYGPASVDEILNLREKIDKNFDKTKVTVNTKGENPLPKEKW